MSLLPCHAQSPSDSHVNTQGDAQSALPPACLPVHTAACVCLRHSQHLADVFLDDMERRLNLCLRCLDSPFALQLVSYRDYDCAAVCHGEDA